MLRRVLLLVASMIPSVSCAIGIAWDAVDDERVHHYVYYYADTPRGTRTTGTTTALEVDLPDKASGRYWVGVKACNEDESQCSIWARGTFRVDAAGPDDKLYRVRRLHSKYRLPAGD